MRKGILFLLIFFFLFSLPVNSYSKDLKFVIVFDSNEENTIDSKNEIVNLINDTLDNVDESSHYDFLKEVHELKRFSKINKDNMDKNIDYVKTQMLLERLLFGFLIGSVFVILYGVGGYIIYQGKDLGFDIGTLLILDGD